MDSAWSLGVLALWTVVLVLAVQLQFLRWTMLMFQRPPRPPDEEDAQRPAVFLIVEPDRDARRQADLPLRLERPPPVPVRQRRRRRRRRRRAGR